MRFRTLGIMTLGSLALSCAPIGQSQSASTTSKVFGYQDARTGLFHPVPTAAPDAAGTKVSGTYSVTFDITLATSFAKGTPIYCSISLTQNSGAEPSSLYQLPIRYESAATTAKVSGSTATCVVNLPYSWTVPSGAGVYNSASLSYTVTAQPASTPLYEIYVLGAGAGIRMVSAALFTDSAIPVSGSVTDETVAVTL